MKFDYTDLINNNFKRQESNDPVFFDEYGFQYFLLTKKLNSSTYFDWDINTHLLTVVKHDKNHNITYKKVVVSEFEYDLIEALCENPNKL